jgi:hypothetical protein
MSNLRLLYINGNDFTGTFPDSFTNLENSNVAFVVDDNQFDRDANHNMVFSPTVQTWFDSLIPYG